MDLSLPVNTDMAGYVGRFASIVRLSRSVYEPFTYFELFAATKMATTLMFDAFKLRHKVSSVLALLMPVLIRHSWNALGSCGSRCTDSAQLERA